MTKHTDLLAAASHVEDRARRVLTTAAVVADALSTAGCSAVLVGGGAVEIYTRSAYTTHDLDFVAAQSDALDRAMVELGFARVGRHWIHEGFRLAVEFPGAVLHPAESVTIDIDGLKLHVIAVEDLIVDRLASWKYWRWHADGAAAALLLAQHPDLDAERLDERATTEDVADALAVLQSAAADQVRLTEDLLRDLRDQLSK